MKGAPFTVHVLHTESIFSRGGEKYLFELLRRIPKKYPVCFHIHAISPEWKRLYARNHVGADILWRPRHLYWLLLPLTIFVNYVRLRKIIKKDDVIFSTSFPMNFLAVILSRRTVCHCAEPLPIFYDEVRIASLPRFSRLCVRVAKYSYSFFDRWAYASCAVLTTLNRSVEQHVRRIYKRRPDVFLPNGIDAQRFSPGRLNKNRLVFHIGHSTDYTVFKGTENFLRMLTFLHERRVPFHAYISESIMDRVIKNKYRSYINNHGLEHEVSFVGTLSETNLVAFYRSLDVFVFTGSPEGSGAAAASMSVLEAQSCGVPVVRSVGDDHEIIDGKTGYYIDPHDYTKSATTIASALHLSKTKKQKMSADARSYVRSHFDWNIAVHVLTQTIRRLTS